MSKKTSKTEANKASDFLTPPETNSAPDIPAPEAIADKANSDAERLEANEINAENVAVNASEDDDSTDKNTQSNNPLHGVKLQTIIEDLEEQYGWDGLAYRININCFKSDPSIKSSLKFLRRTPWARDKVERLYLKTFHKKYRPESY